MIINCFWVHKWITYIIPYFVCTLLDNWVSFKNGLMVSIKGQIISKRFFLAEDSPKKRTKTRRKLVKTN